jgi:hypothetical protein
VVPRAELHYRRLDFTALPERRRAAAARLALLRDDGASALQRIAWHRAIAHVWSWTPGGDATARDRAGWVPESLVRARPASDGPILVATLDGVEGQVWRDGDLVASQWWPAVPSQQAWHRFLRSAALAPAAAVDVPVPAQLGWSAPWARLRGAAGGADVVEATAWRVALAGIAAALGWQVMAHEHERAAHEDLVARMDALRAQATPLLDARERADAAVTEIERLRGLQRASSDYSLMPAVTIPLGEGARLLAWSRQGDVLKAKVAVKDLDPRVVVGAYTRVRLLADAQATPMPPDAVGLEFKLPAAFRAGGAGGDDGSREAGTQE